MSNNEGVKKELVMFTLENMRGPHYTLSAPIHVMIMKVKYFWAVH